MAMARRSSGVSRAPPLHILNPFLIHYCSIHSGSVTGRSSVQSLRGSASSHGLQRGLVIDGQSNRLGRRTRAVKVESPPVKHAAQTSQR